MDTLRDFFFRHVAQTSDSPLSLCVSRAEGVYIYDENGNPFLDCISGISVSNVGHSNKHVIAAIKRQAEKYLHTMVYGEHVQQPQVLLAKKLSSLTQHQLNQVYFLNSGAEAIDATIKLARRFTGKKQIIACKNAYHGSTLGAMSLMSDKNYRKAYGPFLKDVKFIDFNNINSLNIIDNKTAAVIIELVQSEAGYIPIDLIFLKSLYDACQKSGALLIFDEIQTGIGRTGKFFAYQHFNIIPDVIVLAKALGAGLPLAAVMASEKILSVLKRNPVLGHITTFGGNPLSCAASLAAIEYLEKYQLVEQVHVKELLIFEKLKNTEIRGKGLMIAIQLNSHKFVKKVIDYCYQKGILLDWFLFNSQAIRIAPPLTITTEHIEYICQVLNEALNLYKNKK